MHQYTIIDGNLYLRKCAYKGAHLHSSKGDYCGGAYLFLKKLKSIKNRFGGELIVVFDGGHAKYRKEIFPEYKLKEESLPEDEMSPEDYAMFQTNHFSYRFLPYILKYMGVRVIKVPGEEADDVIFILSKLLSITSHVQVVSGDFDYLQMVDRRVSVYNDNLDKVVTPENWDEVVGVKREYYTMYKALMGDTSDGIPGIFGIGDATAKKIVNNLPDVDPFDLQGPLNNVIHWAIPKTTKVQEKVLANHMIVERNYKLMDLRHIPQELIQTVTDVFTSGSTPPLDLPRVAKELTLLDIKSYKDLLL